MFNKSIHLLALTLIIGIFVGCSSSSPFVGGIQDSLKQQNYEAALQKADDAINQYPQDPLAYYYKGVVLGELAQSQEDPGERESYYEKMNQAFAKSFEIANETEGEVPDQLKNLDVVKTTLWRNEHNRAIQLVTDDSLKNAVESPNKKAIQHLQNATVIAPDSALTWSVLSQVHYIDKDLPNAIKTLETAHSKQDSISADSYMRLADYYRINEQPEKSLDVLVEARKKYGENIQMMEKLADSYLGSGQTEKGFDILKELIRQNPNKPRYHLVLGTQYYQTALQLQDSVNTNKQQIARLNQQLKNVEGEQATQLKQKIADLEQKNGKRIDRVEELTQNAIDELNMVIEQKPEEASDLSQTYNTLGIIYQNQAADLFKKRNATPTDQNEKAAEFDKQAKDNLREAMKYYESAVEIEPNNKNYWQALYQVYVGLGMDEKAKEAEEKAGLN